MSITSAPADTSSGRESAKRRIAINAPARGFAYAVTIVALLFGLWYLVPQDPSAYRAFHNRLIAWGIIDLPSNTPAFSPLPSSELQNDPALDIALPKGGNFD